MSEKTYTELEKLCAQFRVELIEMLYNVQTGHPGGSLSACEMLTTLYYKEMNIDSSNPKWEDRDRFVFSKGHGAPMLYIILSDLGFFPKEERKTLRQINHLLQGHPSASKIPGIDMSAGPLGLGLPAAAGLAAGARVQKKDWYTYCMIGDGEMQEGAIWEALFSISKYNLTNLITFLDFNKVQLDGTVDEIMPVGDVVAKFEAFGMNVLEIDGHDVQAISEAIATAKAYKEKPTIIVAHTKKGKGVTFMEGKSAWHGAPIDADSFEKAMAELGGACSV